MLGPDAIPHEVASLSDRKHTALPRMHHKTDLAEFAFYLSESIVQHGFVVSEHHEIIDVTYVKPVPQVLLDPMVEPVQIDVGKDQLE